MAQIYYKRHRFPAEIIQHAVWLCFRFTLSFRDVEEFLAERSLGIFHESIPCWVLKFGKQYARPIDHRRPLSNCRWHLDEVFVKISGKRMYLWRAVDDEGEVLEVLVQSRRNKKAALKLVRKLLKKQGFLPSEMFTDKLPSYGAALRDLGLSRCHDFGGRKNNRAENSHQPVRHNVFS
jgi:transposase-like protein